MLRVGLVAPLSLFGFLATHSEQSISWTVPLLVPLETSLRVKYRDDPQARPLLPV